VVPAAAPLLNLAAVQAGLLKNPSFGARIRFPTSGPGTFLETEFSLVQDFLEYRTVLLPLREQAVKESQLRYNASAEVIRRPRIAGRSSAQARIQRPPIPRPGRQ
jgi:hypothetical protein